MKPEEIAKLTQNAELDQMVAGLAQFAKASRSYYVSLIEEGFTARQAFDLMKHWQMALMSNSSNNSQK